MFRPDSRYFEIETATLNLAAGREVSYKRRRFLPRGETQPLLTEVRIKAGERLDLIAARTLGQADHGWRVADANDAMNPRDLEEPGTVLQVAVPQIVDPV